MHVSGTPRSCRGFRICGRLPRRMAGCLHTWTCCGCSRTLMGRPPASGTEAGVADANSMWPVADVTTPQFSPEFEAIFQEHRASLGKVPRHGLSHSLSCTKTFKEDLV